MAPRGGMGMGSYGRPGPNPGSTFAGGSFSSRRRMASPTSTSTSPSAPTSSSMPGQRTGWGGKAIPPGQMRQIQMGHTLNSHWAPIAQAAGLIPSPTTGTPSATTPTAGAPTHTMPNGTVMPGATHGGFPTQAQVPMPGFMPPGLGRRRMMPTPMPAPMPPSGGGMMYPQAIGQDQAAHAAWERDYPGMPFPGYYDPSSPTPLSPVRLY